MKHDLYVEVAPIIKKYMRQGIHFYYFCGGRGIGKTYGALDLCRMIATGEDEWLAFNKFLYLRRTAVEAQSVASPQSCPFKKYNAAEGYDICADFNSKLGFGNFYLTQDKEEHIGYVAALSTFSNLRGIDFSDVDFILYDECIPEHKNKAPIKDEGFLLLNMLETINRNRGLNDEQEVVLCMLSNPIDLGSAMLSQLNITPIMNDMIFKGQTKYTSAERSLHIERYTDHKVSEMKETTSLYKFGAKTGFNDRALSGNFVDNDMSLVKKVNLSEYSSFLTMENLCVYKHKNRELYHISQIVTPAKYTFKAYEKEKFKMVFYWIYKLLVVDRKVTYDNYQTRVVFDQMINFKPL